MTAVRAVVRGDRISWLFIMRRLWGIRASFVHLQGFDVHLLAALAAGVDENIWVAEEGVAEPTVRAVEPDNYIVVALAGRLFQSETVSRL